jgi:hypothetical protein
MGTEFDALIVRLKDAITKNGDKEAFQELLLTAIKLLDLTDEGIAERFDTSRPTVTRWRNGSNAPHPALRPAVCEWLLELAVARAARYARAEQQEAEARKSSSSGSSHSYPENSMAARGAK